MIHLCRSLLWIFVGFGRVVNSAEAISARSRSVFFTASVGAQNVPNGGSNPGVGGRLNLTEPEPTSYVPPDASAAPPLESDTLYTSSCDPACSGAVAATPSLILINSSTSSSSITGVGSPVVNTASQTTSLSPLGVVTTSFSVQPASIPSDGKGETPTVTPSIAPPPSTIGIPHGSVSPLLTTSSSHSSVSSSSVSSILTNSSTRWHNSTTSFPAKTSLSSTLTRYDNKTSSLPLTVTLGPSQSGINYTNCSTLAPGQPYTVWSIVPNTTTITLTVTGNYSTTYSSSSEFTPPVYCPETTIPFIYVGPPPTPVSFTNSFPRESSSTLQNSVFVPKPFSSTPARQTTTAIITAKNPPVVVTTDLYPSYPNGKTDKQSPTPSTVTNIPSTQILNQDTSANGPITATLDDGTTVVVGPNNVIIGGQTYGIGDSTQTITKGGDVFTIGPSQVIGPMLVVYVPTPTGGVFAQNPTPTTIEGVPIYLGPGGVVIDSSTYAVGTGASDQTIVVKGQTISVGSDGVGFSGTTVPLPSSSPTNVVILGGEVLSAIGSSVAVIEGSSITYGAGIPIETDVINGDTITIGPSGVAFDGTILGGVANPTGTQLGIVGGLSVTEVGSTLAVVDGITLTVGPGAKSTTAIIHGQTVTVGPSGLSVGGATLTFPFNPTTQPVTAGGVTFSEVGSSLVVIGGTTFTFGPGAKTTTDVYDGQTISIGPGGVGFKTTTFTAATATHTGKKNGAGRVGKPGSVFGIGVLGACMVVGVGFFL